ncbi:MAG TPA: quinolinate synthase NadA [Rhodothermales bacterium]|nr:quinolinate synthase NadA [Rhodothermales bacterium]
MEMPLLDIPVLDPVVGFLEEEIDPTLDLFEEIARLKKEKNAVVLAHYYQDADIQEVADYLGDSLGLARQAQATDAELIVFAGVHFMAETAKILNPERKVVLPDLNAGCSLSDTCPPDEFAAFIGRHPGHLVVSYINCSAGVKALSDIIVTSSNAEHIMRQIPKDQPVIFGPDRNLGRWVAERTGRPDMVIWQGVCIVHETFSERRILALKAQHPEAAVLAHPECEESVLRHADFIGSTTGILREALRRPEPAFIVATEEGILHQMRKAAPGKTFIPAPAESGCACTQCPHMKLNTLEKLYLSLKYEQPELLMDETLRVRALHPIERMLEMSKDLP